MATSAEATRPRGRPREFDEEAVVDSLIELFWEQGFEATSLTEIVEASGLNKSSLYATFGSKDEVFLRVLGRYLDERSAVLDGLINGSRGLADLIEFIEYQHEQLTSPIGALGCLAVNTSGELGLRNEAVSQLLRAHRERFRLAATAVLERAAELGEVAPEFVDTYAEAVLAMHHSALLIGRAGGAAEELGRQYRASLQMIESWRIPAPRQP